MTTSFDSMIRVAVSDALSQASALLSFAAKVLTKDHGGESRWVAHAAVDDAMNLIRTAVDEGDDMNVVDAKVSAIRLRVGMSSLEDMLNAGDLADEGDGNASARTAIALHGASHALWKLANAADISPE